MNLTRALRRASRPIYRVAATLLAGLALLAGAVPAHAAPGHAAPGHAAARSVAARAQAVPPTVSIASAKGGYAVGEPVSLTMSVTNAAGGQCNAAALSAGTVSITSMTLDGNSVSPTLGYTYFYEGYASALSGAMKPLNPGQSVSFPLATINSAIAISAPSPGGEAVTALWPIDKSGRYQLSVVYAIPQLTGVAAKSCQSLSAPATVIFTVGEPSGVGALFDKPVVVIGLTALVGLLVVLTIVVLFRRRGPKSPTPVAAKAGVLLAVVVLVLGANARPAQASWDVSRPADVKFEKAVKDCFDLFSAPGGDPAGIMKDIKDANKPKVTISPVDQQGSSTTGTPASPNGPGSSTILYNKDSNFVHVDDGDINSCAELYHELYHAWEFMNGKDSNGECDDTGIQTDEVEASFAENKYRASQHLKPRTTYGKKPLPKSLDECKKKPTVKKGPQPLCNGYQSGSKCAGSNGDPHLVTFNQRRYDLQQVGEYVAVRAGTGDLEIQTRQSPIGTSRVVSANSAVALRIGIQRLGLYLKAGVIEVHRDGQVIDPPAGDTPLAAGAVLTRRGSSPYTSNDAYTIKWPDGSVVWIDPIGIWGLRLLVTLGQARKGQVKGLLGAYDDDPKSALTNRSGTALADSPSFDQLYHGFGDSWRVTSSESLFDYPTGTSTQTYTDLSFPDRGISVNDLPEAQRRSAEAICRRGGVSDPAPLADCVLDVAVTGSADFAVSAETTAAAASPLAAVTYTLTATSPGTPATKTFPAIAGQKVFVEISAATIADSCSAVTLRDPQGKLLATACVIGGKGFLDTTTLPVAGNYTISLDPGPGKTGQAQVVVTTVEDQQLTIGVDTDPVGATVLTPGGLSTLSFTTAGPQKVYAAFTGATLADGCGNVRLVDGGGKVLNSGCVIAGKGYIDAVSLVGAGSYAIVIDPAGAATGDVTVAITSATDEHLSTTVDGPPTLATIGKAGAISETTFTATAGAKVYVTAGNATLPDACGTIWLRAPDGGSLSGGCVLGGKGYIDTTLLPVAGAYKIVVDPGTDGVGHVEIRVTSVTDQHVAISINGSPVTATIGQAGAISELTFFGSAGQAVVVDFSLASIPDACGAIWLRGPDGHHLNSGCLFSGKGSITTTILPSGGSYVIVVDPAAAVTGQVQVRVHT